MGLLPTTSSAPTIDQRELPLARNPLNRNSEARNEPGFYETVLADVRTRVLILDGNLAPVVGEKLQTVPISSVDIAEQARGIYLGKAGHPGPNEHAVHVIQIRAEELAELPTELAAAELSWQSLRECARVLGETDAALLVEATAALNWLENHGFCPACGAPADLTNSGWVRKCRKENRELYPRTDPAIIVSVVDVDNRILLGTSANWNQDHFSVLAGFVEPGESLESAVIREVAEESGVRVTDPVYLASQPWPFPASLMLGFTAQATSTELIPDGLEISALRWFSRDELVSELQAGAITIPGNVSISRAIIEQWYGTHLEDAVATGTRAREDREDSAREDQTRQDTVHTEQAS